MAVSSITNNLPMADKQEQFKPVGNKELGRSDFMTLFITQMQYQDPMKPMDSYEMASQLAQFSSMEATMKMSDNMEKLLAYQSSQNNIQLLGLIDSDVQIFGNKLGVDKGQVASTEFTLADTADVCKVEIYDAAGHLVRTIDMGGSPAGTFDLSWDGKDRRGQAVADGAYSYKVVALDGRGQEVEVDYRTTGHVTGADFSTGAGKAQLIIDNQINVGVDEILKVM
ncbi:MAG: flagellar hook assembly protein FlgD [Desulfobulbaceae bacterium]|nr:flagellar hook assembly protein FlgD [Desulfobulbaceae bacterium]